MLALVLVAAVVREATVVRETTVVREVLGSWEALVVPEASAVWEASLVQEAADPLVCPQQAGAFTIALSVRTYSSFKVYRIIKDDILGLFTLPFFPHLLI